MKKVTVKNRVDAFTIYHWDTFDNETISVGGAKTLEAAERKVEEKYKGRISVSGADRVDIVDRDGNVIRMFHVC